MKEKNVIMPKIVVMQPKVVNVSNPVPLENVALEEFDTEMGVIIQKMDDVNLNKK